MLIVIAGCGRVGSDPALSLSEQGHDVCVADEDVNKLKKLGMAFDGSREVGLRYDVETLRRGGIESAHAFVAVTNTDNQNLMAVQFVHVGFRFSWVRGR